MRDLVIVRMDFVEGQEAVAVAAVLDEGRLQRRLNARHLGEIDIAAELFSVGWLSKSKSSTRFPSSDDHPGFFRVGGVDQHFLGH